MNKRSMLFFAPLLGLARPLMLLTPLDGVAAVIILLGGAMVLPVLHFALVSRYLCRGEDSRRRSAVLTAVSIVALVAMSVLTALTMSGRLTAFWFPAEMAWTALCGVVILTHTVVGARFGGMTPYRIAVALEAVAALAACALLTETLSSRLAVVYDIDGIELLFWPLCWLLLALYSCLLGRSMTGRFALPAQLLWLCGVAASVFVALYLEGSPRTLPTANVTTTVIWIAATAIIFIPGVIAARMVQGREASEIMP